MSQKHERPIESADLLRALSLLNDVYDALQKNEYSDEAVVVSNHLRQLSSPSVQSAILVKGIDPILDELAKEFSENGVAV